ncbi:MAG: FIST C-terminal domain-containing protein [Deltaproteobacteria bacterium]|nr:FIST C-terminal domain-containing protein [Deltaproteobacteria bacterium]
MKLRTFVREASDDSPIEVEAPARAGSRLVIVFGASAIADDPACLARIAAAHPGSAFLGCSTSGEIFGDQVRDESIVGAVLDFERSTVRSASAAVGATADSRAAGESIGRALLSPDLRAVIVLSDGLHVNGSELIRGLNGVLPESVVVTGGLAGDGDKFQRTWVVNDGRPVERCVTAVGLYGDHVRVGHGSKGGWDQFGPERVVTRARGNVLYELDHAPALELYKGYLGERAKGLPATGLLFPLSIRVGSTSDKRLVRTILAVDDATQSLTFAGDIPEGAFAQLMLANFDRLIQGASDAASSIDPSRIGAGDTLSIAISCVGRRLVLGERTEEEIEATLDVLPPGTKQIGFYSYGELSPYASGRCDLHNQTMTLTTIAED